jgi:hypothetical protein
MGEFLALTPGRDLGIIRVNLISGGAEGLPRAGHLAPHQSL